MSTSEYIARLQSAERMLDQRHSKVSEIWRDSVEQRFHGEHWSPIRNDIAAFSAHAAIVAQHLSQIEQRLP